MMFRPLIKKFPPPPQTLLKPSTHGAKMSFQVVQAAKKTIYSAQSPKHTASHMLCMGYIYNPKELLEKIEKKGKIVYFFTKTPNYSVCEWKAFADFASYKRGLILLCFFSKHKGQIHVKQKTWKSKHVEVSGPKVATPFW